MSIHSEVFSFLIFWSQFFVNVSTVLIVRMDDNRTVGSSVKTLDHHFVPDGEHIHITVNDSICISSYQYGIPVTECRLHRVAAYFVPLAIFGFDVVRIKEILAIKGFASVFLFFDSGWLA